MYSDPMKKIVSYGSWPLTIYLLCIKREKTLLTTSANQQTSKIFYLSHSGKGSAFETPELSVENKAIDEDFKLFQ